MKKMKKIVSGFLGCVFLILCTACGTPKLEALHLELTVTDLDISQSADILVTGSPEKADLSKVSCETADSTIAVVENGKVVARAEGVTQVTAKTQDGEIISNTVEIKVVDQKKKQQREAGAKEVETAIDAIGEVTLDSEPLIVQARELYNDTASDVLCLVTNYQKLADAEQSLTVCKQVAAEAAEKVEQERLAAEKAAAEKAAAQKAASEKSKQPAVKKEQKPQEKPKAPPAETEKKPGKLIRLVVYTTGMDNKYHTDKYCNGYSKGGSEPSKYTQGDFVESTKENAKEDGYTPCIVCYGPYYS